MKKSGASKPIDSHVGELERLNSLHLYLSTGVSVRVKGNRIGFGRIEILHNGKWGTVCDDHWNLNDAKVVCRQLGFRGAKTALQGGDVPAGTGQIWLDDVVCTGREQFLANCSHTGWGIHNCIHSEDAGVHCDVPGKFLHNLIRKIALGINRKPGDRAFRFLSEC